ncbi:hypothetical protein AHF37_04001 [Paragonimus kellicotti]|nr:hypothetical protein AHF37_04001 [Paragonimus kellicotti]
MGVLRLVLTIITVSGLIASSTTGLSVTEKHNMRAQIREMFLHGYMSYKENAFPADELMPLSCKGRARNTETSRGDLDDALGNFSLTMIDTLDTLFLFNELDEFEHAVRAVVDSVSFDSDIEVSVFETNIRIIGGLLGAHISSLEVQKANHSRMKWYSDELLQMAIDIGNRLIPAFNTSTGIPLPRVNLRYGCDKLKRKEMHTCTACGGTMILEFAALSRLTGNPVYEDKAARAMAALWKQRNRHSDLMGRVINVHSGDWVRRESGIGAGIDSYYEYLLKAFVLLGEPVYLHRFHTHYDAIKRYVSGPQSATFPFLFLDVHMHRPSERARSFMDVLLSFWPGLQVLVGDVKPAVALHEFLFQVYKRNKLLPEAFTPDLKVHWGEHLLRPEFVESTYLLYRATNDPYYLDVGAQIVADMQRYARVPCGFAAIEDVRTMKHVDRFDSFVLAETFKYLYLLFSEPSDLPISLSEYVFTTEAHLLPISLSQLRPSQTPPERSEYSEMSTTDNTLDPPVQARTVTVELPVDHHGDRDHVTETKLHREGQCPAIHFGPTPLSFSDECKAPSRYFSSKLDWTQTGSMCRTTDRPHWYMNTMLLKNLTRQSKSVHSISPDVARKRVWRSIDLIRQPLRQMAVRLSESVEQLTSSATNQLPQTTSGFVPLRAVDFRPDNPAHLAILRHMGIELSLESDGRLTLKQDQNAADSAQLSIAGLLFIHDLLSLTKAQQQVEVAFTEAMKRLSGDKSNPLQESFLPVAQFAFVSEVDIPTAKTSVVGPRLPSLTRGGLSVSRLAGVQPFCEAQYVHAGSHVCSPQQSEMVEIRWAITLFVESEELVDFVTQSPDGSRSYPHRIELWIAALNHTIIHSKLSVQCRGILLAVCEVALHNSSLAGGTFTTHPTIHLLISWVNFVDRCFTRLNDRARFLSAFSVGPKWSALNDPTFRRVSLVLSFQPVLTTFNEHPISMSQSS